MEHGWMSQQFRRDSMGFMGGHSVAVHKLVRNAIVAYPATTVLRNGPRILRACETMRAQMAAEQEAGVGDE